MAWWRAPELDGLSPDERRRIVAAWIVRTHDLRSPLFWHVAVRTLLVVACCIAALWPLRALSPEQFIGAILVASLLGGGLVLPRLIGPRLQQEWQAHVEEQRRTADSGR